MAAAASDEKGAASAMDSSSLKNRVGWLLFPQRATIIDSHRRIIVA